MHELSIVASLIELCEENARKNKASQISEIHTKIGRLSGIEKKLFTRCFESFKQGSMCENATLFLVDDPLCVKCEECGFEGELKENDFHCIKCGSKELKITSGEDFYLMRLVMS